MNLIELNRSLVQLCLSGMAAVMETRLLQAQSENRAPIDLISALVSDELNCRSKRLLERRHKQAQYFQFNARMKSQSGLRTSDSKLDRKARRCPFSGSAWEREKSLRPGYRTRRHPAGLPCVVSRSPRTAGGSG
jgi:hypothetical protein